MTNEKRKQYLTQFRLRWRLTQAEVGTILGVSLGSVKSYEIGRRTFSETRYLFLKTFEESLLTMSAGKATDTINRALLVDGKARTKFFAIVMAGFPKETFQEQLNRIFEDSPVKLVPA